MIKPLQRYEKRCKGKKVKSEFHFFYLFTISKSTETPTLKEVPVVSGEQ